METSKTINKKTHYGLDSTHGRYLTIYYNDDYEITYMVGFNNFRFKGFIISKNVLLTDNNSRIKSNGKEGIQILIQDKYQYENI